jgi:hypothetical protein
MHSFPVIFLWFIYQNVSNSLELWNNNTRRYEIFHTLNLDCSFITLIEPCNDLDVILHGVMLQTIYTTVFRDKGLDHLTHRFRLFHRLTRKTAVYMLLIVPRQCIYKAPVVRLKNKRKIWLSNVRSEGIIIISTKIICSGHEIRVTP